MFGHIPGFIVVDYFFNNLGFVGPEAYTTLETFFKKNRGWDVAQW
jgi:hypothetical protein